jgi:hypothetical protein
MINIKLFTLLQDIVGSPPRIDLLTKNWNQVTAPSDLADGDD